MQLISSCPICAGATVKFNGSIAPFISHYVLEVSPAPTCELLYCADCDFACSNTRFSEQEMLRLYADYRGENYTAERIKMEPHFKNFVSEPLKIRQQLLLEYVQDIPIHRILDYGSRDADLISPIVNCVESYDPYYSTKPPIGQFDLVTCMHVLEHVSHPLALMEELKKYSGKYIYLEVPLELKDDSRNFSGWVVHEHINFFTEISLRKIIEESKLEILKLDAFAWMENNVCARALCQMPSEEVAK